jgi:signal transducing adaptor molecule
VQLANTLAQNSGKPLLEELSSRNWTTSLDRLVNDRVGHFAQEEGEAHLIDHQCGCQEEGTRLYQGVGEAIRGHKGPESDLDGRTVRPAPGKEYAYSDLKLAQAYIADFIFGDVEPVQEDAVSYPLCASCCADSQADARRRQEEEELARVLELSKQDKGGRNTASYQPPGSSSSTSAAPAAQLQPAPAQTSYQPYQSSYDNTAQPSAARPAVVEPEAPLDVNTATRVRALYAFTSVEVGELNFERGDVIKVLDRGFKEWWRGACNGKIGVGHHPFRLLRGLTRRSSQSHTSRRSASRRHESCRTRRRKKRESSPL